MIEKSIKLNEEIAKSAASASESKTDTSGNVDRKKTFKKRVSFSDSLESSKEFSNLAIEDEIDIIRFKHSESKKPITKTDHTLNNTLNSPSDIYTRFLSKQENIDRKSILKKTSFVNRSEKSSQSVTNENSGYESNKIEKVQKSIIKIKKNTSDINAPILLDEISPDEVRNFNSFRIIISNPFLCF